MIFTPCPADLHQVFTPEGKIACYKLEKKTSAEVYMNCKKWFTGLFKNEIQKT